MDERRSVEVLVIGAGISGIGAVARLRAAGVADVVALEKADAIGGTWRDNTYPGCACDVPSALYSFSFAPNPGWSRLFAGQAEIRAYLERVATEHDVTAHVRHGVAVERADWDPAAQRWRLATTDGPYEARVLVAATGPWHEPRVPDVPGLATFPGAVFHSSRWDHEVDLRGARVAVVGTGASAVQFVPRIQPDAARVHVFQRTAQWVLPKPDGAVPGPARRVLARVPGALRALRGLQYGVMEALGVGFRHPALLRVVQQLGRWQLRRQVADPGLRAALTPDYTLGCKRLLMSDDFYPALAAGNASVHPTAVAEIRGRTVVGADGSTADADVLIFGTGFHVTDMPIADTVHDGAGRSLADRWAGSPQAHLGTTVAGFPNLFLLLGPNLGTGHSSAFGVLEHQLAYLTDAVTTMRRRGWSAVDVRPDVQARHNAAVQDALATTVYNAGGCSSYYLDATGRNSFAWPWSTSAMGRRLAFDPADYAVTGRDEASRAA